MGLLVFYFSLETLPQIQHVLPKLCSQYKYQKEMNEKCWFNDDSSEMV